MAEPLREHPVPSPIELRILRLVVEGKSNRQISSALNMNEDTVKTYVRGLFREWKVNSRGELTYAVLVARVVPCPCCPTKAGGGRA